MSDTKIIHVSHLGGIDAGYQMPHAYDSSKPTLVLVNSFLTSSELYQSQFKNKQLTDRVNLIAMELLGHGQTRCKTEHFTYWDTAIMNLQVLDALGVKGKVFVLGTSQGGWICVRMVLLAPEKIAGIIPLGTSMDYESERTRALGCWDGPTALTEQIEGWSSLTPTPEFKLTEDYCNFLVTVAMGPNTSQDARDFWLQTLQSNYAGDDGRRRARMCAINLRDRDGLHGRVGDVTCPVLWMHGTDDQVYSVKNAEEEIKMFTGAKDAQLKVVEGGQHFLSFSHPEVVDKAVVEFVGKYS